MSEQKSGLNPKFDYGESLARDGIVDGAVDANHRQPLYSVEAATKVAHEVHYDNLTGLLNKKTWRKKLEESLEQGGEKAVLFIDLTNFKKINEEAPDLHESGDRVLKQVGGILKKVFRSSDSDSLSHERRHEPNGEAGRVGGDEFAVILDLTARSEEWAAKSKDERMQAAMERLHGEFEHMQLLNPLLASYNFDVTVGGAVWEPGMDTATLLTNADYDMQAHKAQQHAVYGKHR